MSHPAVTESIRAANLSDVHLMLYGLPLSISDQPGERVTLEPESDEDDGYQKYHPPGTFRAGWAAISCTQMRNGEEEAHATVCARLPSRLSRWLGSVMSSERGEDPRVWLNIETWPPDLIERMVAAIQQDPWQETDF